MKNCSKFLFNLGFYSRLNADGYKYLDLNDKELFKYAELDSNLPASSIVYNDKLKLLFSFKDGKNNECGVLYRLDDNNKPTTEVLAKIDFNEDECDKKLKEAIEKFKAKDSPKTPVDQNLPNDNILNARKKLIRDLGNAFSTPSHKFLPCENEDKDMTDDQWINTDVFYLYNKSLDLKIVFNSDSRRDHFYPVNLNEQKSLLKESTDFEPLKQFIQGRINELEAKKSKSGTGKIEAPSINTETNKSIKNNNAWRYAKIITPIAILALTIIALCLLEFGLAILTAPIGIGAGVLGLAATLASPFLIDRIEKHRSTKNQPIIPD